MWEWFDGRLEGRIAAEDRRGRAVAGSERPIVDDPILEVYKRRSVWERGGRRGRVRRGYNRRDRRRRGRMWSVEEMLGLGRLGLDRDAVQDFLGRAVAESLECLYPGLEHGGGHLGESGVAVGCRVGCTRVRSVNSRVGLVSIRRHHVSIL